MSAKHAPMSATSLRVILVIMLFVTAGVIGSIFYFGRQQLQTIAVDVSHTSADAAASSSNLSTLKQLQATLTTNQSVIDKASLLTANSAAYDYQNQILNDLQTYGQQTGVTVTGVDFSDGASGTATPASTPAGAAQTTAGSNHTVTIGVNLNSPVSYTSLLRFLHSIEQNLPKMQISKLSLSRSPADPTKVTITAISIQMYVK